MRRKRILKEDVLRDSEPGPGSEDEAETPNEDTMTVETQSQVHSMNLTLEERFSTTEE